MTRDTRRYHDLRGAWNALGKALAHLAGAGADDLADEVERIRDSLDPLLDQAYEEIPNRSDK